MEKELGVKFQKQRRSIKVRVKNASARKLADAKLKNKLMQVKITDLRYKVLLLESKIKTLNKKLADGKKQLYIYKMIIKSRYEYEKKLSRLNLILNNKKKAKEADELSKELKEYEDKHFIIIKPQ